jgi:hypothetical protein
MDIFPISFAQKVLPCTIRKRIVFVFISPGVKILSDPIQARVINFTMKK